VAKVSKAAGKYAPSQIVFREK